MVECVLLMTKNAKTGANNSDVTPSALVNRKTISGSEGKVHAKFKPFLSEDSVSLTEGGKKVPVTILRDTGSMQSLIRANTLPFSRVSSVDSEVFVRGVGERTVRVPLHHIHL